MVLLVEQLILAADGSSSGAANTLADGSSGGAADTCSR